MSDPALDFLHANREWKIGSGPSVTVVDPAMAQDVSPASLQNGIYAFVFNRSGLMVGVDLDGATITRTGRESDAARR
jgi:hypothetical protein